mgnify:CR=1 FL=1
MKKRNISEEKYFTIIVFPTSRLFILLGLVRLMCEDERRTGTKLFDGGSHEKASPDFYRPTVVVNPWGNPSKAKKELGWNPTKTCFEELIKLMVYYNMRMVAKENAVERIISLAEYLENGVMK